MSNINHSVELNISVSGRFYVVATPIGNLDDMTMRAVQILRDVDVIAAEDTRRSGRLLAHFNIDTPLISVHEHNEEERCEHIHKRLKEGQNVALISDAGTPLISDPGYQLVKYLRTFDIEVSPIPGASAVIAALSAAGLPSDRFLFEGFLAAKHGRRLRQLQQIAQEPRTTIFYLSVHKVAKHLADCIDVLGGDRGACVARELTKLHETFYCGSLAQLHSQFADHRHAKGEMVLLIEGRSEIPVDDQEIDRVLSILLTQCSTKHAADLASQILNCGKNQAYQRAIELTGLQHNTE